MSAGQAELGDVDTVRDALLALAQLLADFENELPPAHQLGALVLVLAERLPGHVCAAPSCS